MTDSNLKNNLDSSVQNAEIRFVNVTEARANFASLITEKQINYVITRNSKPARALISYGEFEILQHFLRTYPELVQIGQTGELNQWIADLEKKPKIRPENPVEGLLKQRMEAASQAHKSAGTENKSLKKSLPESDLAQQLQERLRARLGIKSQESDPCEDENLEEDYFSAGDEPIKTDESGIIRGSESGPNPAEFALTKNSATSTLDQRADFRVAESQTETQEESFKSDYYKKYRKLYEPYFQESENANSDTEPKLESEPVFVSKHQERETIDTPEMFKNLIESLEKNQEAQEEEETQGPDPTRLSPPEDEPDLSFEFRQEDSGHSDEQNLITKKDQKNDLPSLKDILKEIDDNGLDPTAEIDKTIEEEDIESILKRITQD